MLDYHALKVADAALGVSDPAASATALNAQTVTLPLQDFSALAALNILLINGDWAKVVVRSEVRPLDAGGAVAAAISAIALLQSRGTIQATNPATWSAFTACVNALVLTGDISSNGATTIAALASPVVPKWPVVLTANDITTARSLP